MDPTAPLIFVSVFVLASISLFLVYKCGIKKKSYEEALAEHRKQTNTLVSYKPKSKEKKNKKASKKVNKEKPNPSSAPESETPDETESHDSKDLPEKPDNMANVKSQPHLKSGGSKAKASSKQNKVHVEFKEEPEEVPVEVPAEKEVKEVINKKRVKKVRPILIKKSSEPEIILPIVETPVTNHFEEILPKDEFELLRANSREDINKSESPKEEKKPEKSSKKNKQSKPESTHQVEKNGANGDTIAAIEKEKSEKPREEKAVENIIAPPVQEAVVNTAKEKKKKKSEYNTKQQMTAERDQLMQSVRTAELSRTEVQMLIDLLLNKQLEAPAVIDDWSEGKSDPVQKLKKQLADKERQLADEQEALVGVQAKLKEVRNEQLAERAQLQQKLRAAEESKIEIVAAHNRLQQKVQELEEYRNKDLANFQRVVEENKTLQLQRGQLEATLMNYQETDALIHNLKTENAHLTNQLQLLTQERQEEMQNYQNCVLQIQSLQEELRAANEYFKNQEMNHNFALTAQKEENRNLAEQLQRVSDTHLKEEQKLKDIIAQLKAENQKLQEENSAQLNGSSEESKEHEVKVLNLTNELTSVKTELSSVRQSLLDAEKQYKTNLSSSQEKYNQLKIELEEQKNKNNDLRKKNWKVVEALNAAENRNKQASDKSAAIDVDKITAEIKTKEENAQKEFIHRLFPEIDSLKSVSSENWQEEFEHVIRQHISQLQQKTATVVIPDRSEEVSKLQSEVQYYKKIIDETESILKKLHSHVEQEERKWRIELSQKDAEIQDLKNRHISQLQMKVSTLEAQLDQERVEKSRLLEERQQSIDRPEVKTIHSDSTATIEKLSEELDRLREQLRLEQTKNNEVGVYQNGETS